MHVEHALMIRINEVGTEIKNNSVINVRFILECMYEVGILLELKLNMYELLILNPIIIAN